MVQGGEQGSREFEKGGRKDWADDVMRKPVGWRGNPQGHSLARRGIKLYASVKTQRLVDPVFYARREQKVPFHDVMAAIREGQDYTSLRKMLHDADPEDVRVMGIKAYESLKADGTLSYVNKTTPDQIVKLGKMVPSVKEQVMKVLRDRQARSFIPSVKVEVIEKELAK